MKDERPKRRPVGHSQPARLPTPYGQLSSLRPCSERTEQAGLSGGSISGRLLPLGLRSKRRSQGRARRTSSINMASRRRRLEKAYTGFGSWRNPELFQDSALRISRKRPKNSSPSSPLSSSRPRRNQTECKVQSIAPRHLPSVVLHPLSFIVHPSSFTLHPSDFILSWFGSTLLRSG